MQLKIIKYKQILTITLIKRLPSFGPIIAEKGSMEPTILKPRVRKQTKEKQFHTMVTRFPTLQRKPLDKKKHGTNLSTRAKWKFHAESAMIYLVHNLSAKCTSAT
jgi:hypothetical protein